MLTLPRYSATLDDVGHSFPGLEQAMVYNMMPSHKIIDNLGEKRWETSGRGDEMRRGGTRRGRHIRDPPLL